MTRKPLLLAVFPLTIASAFAQTSYVEIEPNSTKAQANVLPPLASGDSVIGTSQVAGGGPIDFDYYLLETAPLPPGVYQHRLYFGSLVGTNPLCSIFGTTQSIVPGVGGVPTTVETLITQGSPSQWYGFGKGERLYCRADVVVPFGPAPNYVMTLLSAPVPITVIAPVFESANPIVITTIGTSALDTSIHVYDGSFNAIPGCSNDDEFVTGTSLQSYLSRSYAPGTYYIALASGGTAWNLGAPVDDNVRPALLPFRNLMEFANAIARPAGAAAAQTWDFRILASNGVVTQPATLPANSPADILWFQFTVAAGAPTLNDACTGATVIVPGLSYTESFATAVNNGSSSCDPGGPASRDVWFRYTNLQTTEVVLFLDTCGSAADTVLSILAACGGPELACNDDCGGGPCGGTSSCTTRLVPVGQTVFVRVSDKGLAGTSFVLNTSARPLNDECTAPKVLPGPGVHLIDNAFATTSANGQGEGACNFAGGTAIARDLWYTYTPQVFGPVQISTCGLVGAGPNDDSKIAVYPGTGCPVPGSAIACSDNTAPACAGGSANNATVTFNAVCGAQYLIQIGMSPLANLPMQGSFRVQELGPALGAWCATPYMKICTGDVVGTTCVACGNNGQPGRGCANSAYPAGADLVPTGAASVTAAWDTFALTAIDITGPGQFIQSTNLVGPLTFGDGMFCAAAGVARLGVVFPIGGVAVCPGGAVPAVPIHTTGAPLAAGATRYYQCWYRDAAAFCTSNTYNLTPALVVTWYP